MSEVESLEGHYFELKSKLSTGALTPEEFRHQVARLWFEDAVHQLIHDDAIALFAFVGVRPHALQAARGELPGINLAVDEPARSGDADAPEAARDGLCRDNLGDVRPWQGRSRRDVREGRQDRLRPCAHAAPQLATRAPRRRGDAHRGSAVPAIRSRSTDAAPAPVDA